MDIGLIIFIIVLLFRLLAPLTILKWPFWGLFIAILGDISDVMLFQKFGSGPLTGEYYHNFDKLFDTWYLFLAFVVVFRWKDVLARRTAKLLFIWRFAGFAVFEIATLFGMAAAFRPAFLFAPNIFEFFFLFWAFVLKFAPGFKLTPKRLIIVLLLIGVPKIIQEYIMHYRFTDQTWAFIRDNFFYWLYD